jgi:protoheme ferro-lyase
MEDRLKEILETVKDISKDTKALAINEGRNHERLKSLEATRKWVSVIFSTVIAAVIIGVLI